METPTSYLALFEQSIFALFWDTLLCYIVSYWWVQGILLYILTDFKNACYLQIVRRTKFCIEQ